MPACVSVWLKMRSWDPACLPSHQTTPPHPPMLPATGRCLFQACPIISSSLVTFRNLIITSAISSAGVKVRANACSNDRPPPPLRSGPAGCGGIPACSRFPDAFRSEYFYGFSADVRRAWASANTAYIKHEASVPGPACRLMHRPVHQPWDLLVRAKSHCFPPLPFRVGGKNGKKMRHSPQTQS